MVYNLYFESKKQAHIVRLGDISTSNQYLTINTSGRDELLTLDKSITLVSSTSIDDDKKVFVNDIVLDEKTITICFEEKKANKEVSIQNEYIKINEEKNSITIENTTDGQNTYAAFKVVFKFNDYVGEITVHCIPSTDLYDVVLDFGSEASQMLIHRKADGAGVTPHSLFPSILRHYWQTAIGSKKRVYNQQDDNGQLFRSIFFRKENATMDDDFELREPTSHDNFINFITKRNQNSGERIPNVKISFLTGQQLEGTDRTRLHIGIIMRFLHEAIKRIGEIQHGAKRSTDVYTGVRFTLLLPNVMPQSNVSALISKLQELANSESFLNKFSKEVTIPFIQVCSCSESDASFMDRMNKIGLHSGDRCLTIDIGKGTTDFSITKRIDTSNATSIFRSGFVGAGNALSYAIFANFVEQMVGEAKKKEVIKKILDAEPALLFDLDNIIEEKKHNWQKYNTPGKKITSIAPTATVEAILDRMRFADGISDITDAVSIMAEQITDNILNRLPDVKINKIVISGRAFRFKELENVLTKKLSSKFKGVVCEYHDQSAKSGCLLGASSNIRLSLSSTMVGMPFILDASELDLSNPKEFLEEITQSANTDKSVSALTHSLPNNNKLESFKRAANSMLAAVSEWFKNDDAGYSRGTAPTKSRSTAEDEAKEIMCQGKEYPKINSNSLISISGRYYVPADQYAINENHRPYQIYFDGSEFYLRHKNGSHKLVAAAMQGEQTLCFESQFPYSRSLYNDDSYIPD